MHNMYVERIAAVPQLQQLSLGPAGADHQEHVLSTIHYIIILPYLRFLPPESTNLYNVDFNQHS
jgi:hypothetical protein